MCKFSFGSTGRMLAAASAAVFAMSLAIKAAGNSESDFYAEPINGGKSVIITGYKGEEWEVKIPGKIRGLPVTHIGEEAFKKKKLINVTIPNSVTEIGESAFEGNQLTSITIPNAVAVIGVSAFASNQLTSVTIPNSVRNIGKRAFEGSQLTNVTIHNGVAVIDEYAFYGNKLTSVTIPNSVTNIGAFAFDGDRLTSVTIGANVNINERIMIDPLAGNKKSYRDDEVMIYDGFGKNRFCEAYRESGGAAGTYTRPSPDSKNWTKTSGSGGSKDNKPAVSKPQELVGRWVNVKDPAGIELFRDGNGRMWRGGLTLEINWSVVDTRLIVNVMGVEALYTYEVSDNKLTLYDNDSDVTVVYRKQK